MPASVNVLTFPGPMNERGFSLYVWKTEHKEKGELLYVGRTGDSSSPNASSPIKRMGQHLDSKAKGNSLYQWLEKNAVTPELCTTLTLVSYGPLFEEIQDTCQEPMDEVTKREKLMALHKVPRDKVGALEKGLADTLARVGYLVMNPVNGESDTNSTLWSEVLEAFIPHFPKLNKARKQ